MKRTLLLSIILLFFCSPSHSSQVFSKPNGPLYDMQDLRVLVAEKNYNEFFAHARDIRPGERGEEWKQMVSRMAEGFTQEKLKKTLIDPSTFETVESLVDWPTLKSEEFFLRNRGLIGLRFFTHCLEKTENQSKDCFQKIKDFWFIHPHDPELGIKLGELIQKFDKSQELDLWPFFKVATDHNLSSFFCRSPNIKSVILNQLFKDTAPIRDNDEKMKAILEKYLNKDCWNEFKQDLKNGLFASRKEIRDFSFRLLSLKEDIDQEHKDFYHVLFILDGPIVGETFNKAWNALKDLGGNYPRRQKIFEKLKTMDPLPDDFLTLHDTKKKSTLLSFFSQNFPEYWDFYAQTCLSFLQGSRSFKNGNPTLHCKELFELAKNSFWVAPHLQKTYFSLRKY